MSTHTDNPINQQISHETCPHNDSIQMKAIAAQYSRKFNLGNYESLSAECVLWARVREGEAVNVHTAMTRLRDMARENVRAQLLYHKGSNDPVFLGLQPLENNAPDPFYIKTVSVSISRRVNLGDYNAIEPSYTDWADLRDVSHSPSELHIAMQRMWASIWANIHDEIARAAGRDTPADAFFGLPLIPIEDEMETVPVDEQGIPYQVNAYGMRVYQGRAATQALENSLRHGTNGR